MPGRQPAVGTQVGPGGVTVLPAPPGPTFLLGKVGVIRLGTYIWVSSLKDPQLTGWEEKAGETQRKALATFYSLVLEPHE